MGLKKSQSTGQICPKLESLKREYARSGSNFFRNSVVQSSKGFFEVSGGTILAIPYRTGAVRSFGGKSGKGPGGSGGGGSGGNNCSEYHSEFGEKRYCYSSMDNKPLTKYDPLAYRSRNASCDLKQMSSNASTVTFDQGLFCDKRRQFFTTNGQYYNGKPVNVCSNPGILADKYMITRTDRAK